ncbi:MAG: UDP-N-acetylmuramoyl-L-alanine--D-glutamate ligase [Candidatus Omnitrophica bacterium]|nr:UDP-N-acetylmuramoyl-L-alanine--D-glutamate ligase [Candidatus Omnitrophota bacterium]
MRKVVVIGLGKSGMAAARLVAEQGHTVFISELKEDDTIVLSIDSLVEEKVVERGNIEAGLHTDRFIKGSDLMVISPGVGPDSIAVKLAEEGGIPIISELELGYNACPAPILAVTGTSGKTTVTTLIGQMLSSHGRDTIVCGNIGNPLSGEIGRIKKDSIVVLEVSSFQLERIKTFKPKSSIILNISDNHLDRYKDIEEYVGLKKRVFLNQDKGDIVFLNGRDKLLREISQDIKARVELFDTYKDFGNRFNIRNENFLAAMSMASLEGVNESVMLDVISRFKGIEHRLEYAGSRDGIDFINDSKATTVSSVEWALRSLDGRIILIMGGRYKGGDFGRLKAFLDKKVDLVIAIGEASPEIKGHLNGYRDLVEGKDLEDAVGIAFKRAKKGHKILLSPGCSSFDMFKNYEERGRAFKDYCKRLIA